MRPHRYTIVGQGLAGSWLAWWLLEAGQDVTVVDPLPPDSSSRVAAGLVNPITGARVKSTWRGADFVPAAERDYAALETRWQTPLVRRYSLRRIFRDARSYDYFLMHRSDGEFDWIPLRDIQPGTHDGLSYPFGGFAHDRAWTVDTGAFLDGMLAEIRRRGRFVRAQVVPHDELLAEADVVVWCEGFAVERHPLWSWLPMAPVKGEIVDVVLPGSIIDDVISSGIWIIPLGDGRYRVGSTYDWDDRSPDPTAAAAGQLLEAIQAVTGRHATIVGHRAAVRPATFNRRPYLGRHPVSPTQVVFNGLGTKGTLLAPWMARHLVEHLVYATPLDPDVDCSRSWSG